MRKAQSGSGINAAILVAIISAFIIAYIIFLPQSEKERFLLNKTGSSSGGDGGNDVLLREFPGTLSRASGLEDEKNLPNIFLIEATNAQELAKINPFIVKGSVFGNKPKSAAFALEDLENTDNVVLTFTPKKKEGILSILLNGNNVYENEITSGNIEPIQLERGLLKRSNTLEFSVSRPGIKFWASNEYALEDIRIIGDITDKSRQQSQNVFTLTESEVTNIEKSTLKFIPYCKSAGEVGTLDISVNSKKVFSSVPVCDDPYRQVIPTGVLNEGENNLVFRTARGSYSIEQIVLNFNFKEAKTKTYYFEINDTHIRDINESDKDVTLSLKFVDGVQDKDIRLDVNGHFSVIDERKSTFSRNINDDIVEGNNFVRLTPLDDDVDVVELKVEIADR